MALEVTVAVLNENVKNLTRSVDLLQDTMFKRQDEMEARLVKEDEHLSNRIHQVDEAATKLFQTRASKDDVEKLERKMDAGLALKANVSDTQPIRAFVTDMVKLVMAAAVAATAAGWGVNTINKRHDAQVASQVQMQRNPAPAPITDTGSPG